MYGWEAYNWFEWRFRMTRRKRYKKSPSLLSIHMGVRADGCRVYLWGGHFILAGGDEDPL